MDLQLNSVFQNLPVGIYAGNIEGDENCDCVPATINDSVCRMTGFSRKEISERFNTEKMEILYSLKKRIATGK